jgi:uncharacterized protein YbjT (DUF2867 family)
MRVLVLGGRGFIGRHVVQALIARNHVPLIGTRRRTNNDPCMRQIVLHRLTEPQDWQRLLHGVDVVVNTVGILRERFNESYNAVHHRGPAALALACAKLGLRLVHISALGLRDSARSRFILSKLAGERAIASSKADYTIVRPSLVDGEGGFGARWMRWLARFPVHASPSNATGRIAALDGRDLGEAIAALCESAGLPPRREVELGGTELRTMRDYLTAMRPPHLPPAAFVTVPSWVARIASHVCDVLHFSPFSFGHFELLQRDNVPRENQLSTLLGRAPRFVGYPATNVHAPGQAFSLPSS